jgi:2-phosphosulfolactate phosphatase
MPTLELHPCRTAFDPEDLAGGVAVVFDVLRATTSLTAALGAGALRVWPTETLEAARESAARRRAASPATPVLLAGERQCLKPEGFDLGNSPAEHADPRVRGAELVFTTTNGTRALLACQRADAVWVGCFWNQRALLERLSSESRPVHLVAAGTAGRVAYDDVLAAAALARDLESTRRFALGDGARACIGAFGEGLRDERRLAEALRHSQAAENLRRAGCADDLARVARWNITETVPAFDPGRGCVEEPTSHG